MALNQFTRLNGDEKMGKPYRNISSPSLRLFLGGQLLFCDSILNDGKFLPGERSKGGQTALGFIFCLIFGHGGVDK